MKPDTGDGGRVGRSAHERARVIGRAALRGLGGRLHPAIFARVVLPFAATAAAVRVLRGTAQREAGAGGGFRALMRCETGAAMSGLAWVFRDRFGAPSWQRRVLWDGLGLVESSLRQGRAVVLATAHTEPMPLLARLLYARGLEVAFLVEDASRHSRRAAAIPGATGVSPPVLLEASGPRAVLAYLSRPRVLVAAVDVERGRCLRVACAGTDATVRIATGPIRIARDAGALLAPCVVVQEGLWRYRVVIGPPAGRECSVDDAARYLAERLLAVLAPRPRAWTGILHQSVRRGGVADAVPGKPARLEPCR